MDKTNQQIDDQVKRMFGPGAELTGSMGSSVAPGTLEILVSGRVVGTGATFQDALRDAQATLSCVLATAG